MQPGICFVILVLLLILIAQNLIFGAAVDPPAFVNDGFGANVHHGWFLSDAHLPWTDGALFNRAWAGMAFDLAQASFFFIRFYIGAGEQIIEITQGSGGNG
nr:hypothetical protein [Novosphingobium sp. B-7]